MTVKFVDPEYRYANGDYVHVCKETLEEDLERAGYDKLHIKAILNKVLSSGEEVK